MKVAIFHNFMDNIGGAEKVALCLAREFKADLYTTNINKEKIIKMGFPDVLPRIFSIGGVPLNAPFRHQFSLWRFRKLNLKNKYDFFIIAGDWAVSGAVNNNPNLWYVHSPIREIWDLHEYTKENNVPHLLWPVFNVWASYNRCLNRKYIRSVNKIVCNSNNTKSRISKYLKKEAVVINPPIDIKNFYYRRNGDFWLSVNRLITHKRVDIQIRAFSKMPNEKLIIVGSYEKSHHFRKYADYIKKIKPGNVEIKNWVSENDLADLYANCKGLITTSKDEDFGMNAVEAMASGKPVIAPNEGGYKETVTKETGILVDNIDENKLKEAIERLENPEKFKNACQMQARKFDIEIFNKRIKEIIYEG